MQLDLSFDPRTHARRHDPATSAMAAERVKEFASGHCKTILDCLQEHGPQTIDEIAKRTDLTSTQIARRLPDLQKAGKTLPTDQTRLSASGRQERVWKTV